MMAHTIDQHRVQYDDFIQVVHPHVTRQYDDKHNDRTAVEGHHIDHFHQLFALATEINAHFLREIIAIFPMQISQHLLQYGGSLHLYQGIPPIEEIEKFRHAVFRLLMLCHHLLERLEFRSLLFADKIEVERLVVVGNVGLQQVRHSGKNRQNEEKIGTRLIGQAQCQTDINASEPNIARKTVQYTSDLRLDARQTCQLPVDTIQDIGKHQTEYTIYIVANVAMIKEKPVAAPTKIEMIVIMFGVTPVFRKARAI